MTLAPEGREGGSFLQALHFDPSGGELLVAASNEGLLSIQSTPQLLQSLPRGADGGLLCRHGAAPAAADPLLLLDCGMPRLHSVRWDPRHGAAVGVTSPSTRQLLLFDLEHTQVSWAVEFAEVTSTACSRGFVVSELDEPDQIGNSLHTCFLGIEI